MKDFVASQARTDSFGIDDSDDHLIAEMFGSTTHPRKGRRSSAVEDNFSEDNMEQTSGLPLFKERDLPSPPGTPGGRRGVTFQRQFSSDQLVPSTHDLSAPPQRAPAMPLRAGSSLEGLEKPLSSESGASPTFAAAPANANATSAPTPQSTGFQSDAVIKEPAATIGTRERLPSDHADPLPVINIPVRASDHPPSSGLLVAPASGPVAPVASPRSTVAGRSAAANGWKVKYEQLKEEFDDLAAAYDEAVVQCNEKDRRIELLKSQLDKAMSGMAHGPGDSAGASELGARFAAAERKILSQNEEIQKLLEQRIKLETELAAKRIVAAKRGDADDIVGTEGASGRGEVSHSSGTFELERIINNLRATVREKDDQIEELREELEVGRAELLRLGEVMGVVAHQVGDHEKKKKRTWWGGSKKRKPDPTKVSAAELGTLSRDAANLAEGRHLSDAAESAVSLPGQRGGGTTASSPVTGGVGSHHVGSKREKSPGSVASGKSTLKHHRGLPDWHSEAGSAPPSAVVAAASTMNKRLLELERENARLEGELQIVNSEKAAHLQKVKHLDAQVEALQKLHTIDSDRLTGIAVAKGFEVPIPKEGGSESDQMRMILQYQEVAMQRLSIKCSQLADVLRGSTCLETGRDARTEAREKQLLQEIQTLAQECSALKVSNSKAEIEIRTQAVKLSSTDHEVLRLRNSLQQAQELHRSSSQTLRKQINSYVLMIGSLLKENEALQEELIRLRQAYGLSVKEYHGELRGLREGRLKRIAMPGRGHSKVEPWDRVFPGGNQATPSTSAPRLELPSLEAACPDSPKHGVTGPVYGADVDPPSFEIPAQAPPESADEAPSEPADEAPRSAPETPSPTSGLLHQYRWESPGYNIRKLGETAEPCDFVQPAELSPNYPTPTSINQARRPTQSGVRAAVTVVEHTGNATPVGSRLAFGAVPQWDGAADESPVPQPLDEGVTATDRRLAQTALRRWFERSGEQPVGPRSNKKYGSPPPSTTLPAVVVAPGP